MTISVFQIFKIGIGPSSSHTVGPMKAARNFLLKVKKQGNFRPDSLHGVKTELFGSLALTGHGHGTDKAIILGLQGEEPDLVDTSTVNARIDYMRQAKTIKLLNEMVVPFSEKEHLVFHRGKRLPYHTNGMRFTALGPRKQELFTDIFYSVGGGFIVDEETAQRAPEAQQANADARLHFPFPFASAKELLEHCKTHNMSIAQVMMENEKVRRSEKEVKDGLLRIWSVMQQCVQRGCTTEGFLPGPLRVQRRAPQLYRELHSKIENPIANPMIFNDWANLYALAVNEENAAGGRVVTAPTNGAAGVIPAVLHYYDKFYASQRPGQVLDFLLTSAAVGILFKEGASISGAEAGCQGEVGVACSMAAAGLTAALGGTPQQVENAAEIGMEHNLGLTCDPVGGLVQIPCIERNTMGAIKAINAASLALRGDGTHKVSLDRVIRVMKRTGDDMKTKYKETSRGGLALEFADTSDSVGLPEC
eukprot:GILI01005260.1.p1 GENE.GILI01005260.1~~GILI01005260.1.p1  ORF type:complete len:476 (+),score=151.52 GILI01005260.1:222-1649(+)